MGVFAILLLMLSSFTGHCEAAAFIIGGSSAEVGSHPSILSLQVWVDGTWYHLCGGALIASDKGITAAHCLQGFSSFQKRVKVGAVKLTGELNQYEQTTLVQQELIHPEFNPDQTFGTTNDIALLFFDSNVTYNLNVQPAVLPTSDSTDVSQCTLIGWGYTSLAGPASNDLQEISVTVINNTECQNQLSGVPIASSQICTSGGDASPDQPRACFGDSGGPLVCGSSCQHLIGIASFVAGQCDAGFPFVYTRVTSYLDFISSSRL